MRPREPKKRNTPAFDRAVVLVKKLQAMSLKSGWSPPRLRFELKDAQNACDAVWRRAIVAVFGVTARSLPDTRQLPLFKAAS